jgi:hypothetical protein
MVIGSPRLVRSALLLILVGVFVSVRDPGIAARAGQKWENAAAPLPPKLQGYLTKVGHFTGADINSLLKGNAVARLLDADTAQEVSAFGAVWINASPKRYIDALNDIETLERGGKFLMTKRISSPPRIEDFAPLHLPDEDIEALRHCEVGRCDVKLSGPALKQLRTTVDWSSPNAAAVARALVRRNAFDLVNAYLEGGNERLGIYLDTPDPMAVSAEIASMVNGMPEVAEYAPSLQRYLMEFPKGAVPGDQSFLYWQMVNFGLKPTLRINHVVIRPTTESVAIAIKMLYASHYFWAALDVRLLVPDPGRGPGFWLITHGRSRSDGLTGFKGWFVRRRVRSGAYEGSLEILRVTKARLEEQERQGSVAGPANATRAASMQSTMWPSTSPDK